MGCLRLYEAADFAAAILASLSQTLAAKLGREMSEIPTYLSQTLILRNTMATRNKVCINVSKSVLHHFPTVPRLYLRKSVFDAAECSTDILRLYNCEVIWL